MLNLLITNWLRRKHAQACTADRLLDLSRKACVPTHESARIGSSPFRFAACLRAASDRVTGGAFPFGIGHGPDDERAALAADRLYGGRAPGFAAGTNFAAIPVAFSSGMRCLDRGCVSF